MLATVFSDPLNAWLNAHISENEMDNHDYWIGYYAVNNQDGAVTFNWESGESGYSYSNWAPEEPDISSQCVFPFTYRRKPYDECTTDGIPGKLVGLWCSQDRVYPVY